MGPKLAGYCYAAVLPPAAARAVLPDAFPPADHRDACSLAPVGRRGLPRARAGVTLNEGGCSCGVEERRPLHWRSMHVSQAAVATGPPHGRCQAGTCPDGCTGPGRPSAQAQPQSHRAHRRGCGTLRGALASSPSRPVRSAVAPAPLVVPPCLPADGQGRHRGLGWSNAVATTACDVQTLWGCERLCRNCPQAQDLRSSSPRHLPRSSFDDTQDDEDMRTRRVWVGRDGRSGESKNRGHGQNTDVGRGAEAGRVGSGTGQNTRVGHTLCRFQVWRPSNIPHLVL